MCSICVWDVLGSTCNSTTQRGHFLITLRQSNALFFGAPISSLSPTAGRLDYMDSVGYLAMRTCGYTLSFLKPLIPGLRPVEKRVLVVVAVSFRLIHSKLTCTQHRLN